MEVASCVKKIHDYMDYLDVIVNNCGYFFILFEFLLRIHYLICDISSYASLNSCLFATFLSPFHTIGHQLSIFFSIILVSKQ